MNEWEIERWKQKKEGGNTIVHHYFNNISSVDALSYVRDIVEAIDSCRDSINQIFLYLGDFLVEI